MMICDREGCRHLGEDHDGKGSACRWCPCQGFIPPPGLSYPPPPSSHDPEDIEQYLNEMDPMPPLAAGLVSLIEAGHLDRYLELILNAAHNRKRTMRGTPGFRGGLRRRR